VAALSEAAVSPSVRLSVYSMPQFKNGVFRAMVTYRKLIGNSIPEVEPTGQRGYEKWLKRH